MHMHNTLFILLQEGMSQFAQSQQPIVSSRKDIDIWTTSADTAQPIGPGVEPRAALIDGPQLARKISWLGIPQLVCGVLMTCGMILYLGIILGEINRTEELFGFDCYYVDSWDITDDNLPYAIAFIVGGGLVSLS